jgi:hypothetical protein
MIRLAHVYSKPWFEMLCLQTCIAKCDIKNTTIVS